MNLGGRRVGVVFGSRSVEHEISIITACQVMPVLEQLGAEVVPLYITKSGRWLTGDQFSDLATFRKELPEEGEPVLADLDHGGLLLAGRGMLSRPRPLGLDLLFPLTHGTMGEDGTIAGLAEMIGLRQVGCSVLAAALAMDKYRSKTILGAAGLPVVPGRLTGSSDVAQAASELGFPLVLKPNRGGSSIGVALVTAASELETAAQAALAYDGQLILEPAVVGAQDLNCAVKRGGPRSSEVERPLKQAGLLSYADKYASSGKSSKAPAAAPGGAKLSSPDPRRELPARISPELAARVKQLALAAFDLLGCRGTARVDFLLSSEGDLYLNEVNTIPGSLAFYLWEASGVSFAELVQELCREALEDGDPRQLSLSQNLLAPDQLLGKG